MSSFIHKKHNLRYKITEDGDGYQGYIYDRTTHKQSKFKTSESRAKDALEVVKAKIESVYGQGLSLEDATCPYRAETIKSVIGQYIHEHYKAKIANCPQKPHSVLSRFACRYC